MIAAPWDIREPSIESLCGTGAIQRSNAREDAAQTIGRPFRFVPTEPRTAISPRARPPATLVLPFAQP